MLFLTLTLNSASVVTGVPCIAFTNLTLEPTDFAGLLGFATIAGGLEVEPDGLGSTYGLLYFDAAENLSSEIPLSPVPSQVMAIIIGGQNCVLAVQQQVIDPIQFPDTALPFGYNTGNDNGYANQVFLAPFTAYAEDGYWDPTYSV